MSWHASSWASWYSESRLSDRLVIFVIAHHVSDIEGEAHPSIETICKETRLGRSTVIASIYNLAKMGELSIQRGGKFRGDSNSYILPKFNLWVQSLNPTASDKRLLSVRKGSKVAPHRIVGRLEGRNVAPISEIHAGTGPEVRTTYCAICRRTGSWHLNAAKHGEQVDHEFAEAI